MAQLGLDLTKLYVRYLSWSFRESWDQLSWRVQRAAHSWCPCSAWEGE